MSWVWFELTIAVFDRAKTVHASDISATVIGMYRDNALEDPS
jgi:hypothetical protein